MRRIRNDASTLYRMIAIGSRSQAAIPPSRNARRPTKTIRISRGPRRGDGRVRQGLSKKGLDEGQPVIAPPPPPPPRNTIMVNRATYGAGGRRCDASRAVGNIANGQVAVSVEANNDLCGDPAREQKKRLEVDYQCGRAGKRAFANERDSVYLDCR
jgi:hypothetical protein